MGRLGNGGVAGETVTPALGSCWTGCVWVGPLQVSCSGLTCLQTAGGRAPSSQARVVTPGDSGPGARWLGLFSLFRTRSAHFWGLYWVPGTVLGDTAEN